MKVLNIIKNNLFQTSKLIIKYLKKFTLMKIVISQPHGNQNTSEAVKSLEKFGLLDTFWTTISFLFSFNIF